MSAGLHQQASAVVRSDGYKAFGSFHVEQSVEELIRNGFDVVNVNSSLLELYEAPPRPFSTTVFYSPSSPPPSFGQDMKRWFMIRHNDYTFLNHGAFGAAVMFAIMLTEEYRLYAEMQPVRYIDRELFPLLVHSVRRLSHYVGLGLRPWQMSLVPNVSYGLSSIILSIPLPPDPVFFTLNINYGSTKHLLHEAARRRGGSVVVAEVRFPIIDYDILMDQIIFQIPITCHVCVFDYITSNTAMVLPVKQLTAAAHDRGAIVIVDGAHALGSLEIDVVELNCDYFVANCHKWMSSPRGVGMIYESSSIISHPSSIIHHPSPIIHHPSSFIHHPSPTDHHLSPPIHHATLVEFGKSSSSSSIHPAVISHGYNSGFSSEFIWDGNRDYSAAVVIPDLLDWWEWVDIKACQAYCRSLLKDAIKLLCTTWGTSTHVPICFYNTMACIEIPSTAVPLGAVNAHGQWHCTSSDSKLVQDALFHSFHIEVPIKTLMTSPNETRCFVRISAFIYNTLDDYRALALAMLRMRWTPPRGESSASNSHLPRVGNDKMQLHILELRELSGSAIEGLTETHTEKMAEQEIEDRTETSASVIKLIESHCGRFYEAMTNNTQVCQRK